jgi:hypothetical protein
MPTLIGAPAACPAGCVLDDWLFADPAVEVALPDVGLLELLLLLEEQAAMANAAASTHTPDKSSRFRVTRFTLLPLRRTLVRLL